MRTSEKGLQDTVGPQTESFQTSSLPGTQTDLLINQSIKHDIKCTDQCDIITDGLV